MRRSAKTNGATWSRSRIAGAVLALVVLVVLGRRFGSYVPEIATRIHAHGIWGPVVFVIVYAMACVALVPASVLTLAAGAVFGLVEGTIVVFIAATLAAAAAFLIARYVARGMVERRLGGNNRFVAIDRALAVEGFKIVVLLRLSPLFPFSFLNYALGLTRVRLLEYLLASIGMIPGTVLYVYYGKLAGDVAALSGTAPVHRGTAYYAVLGVGLVATVAATIIIARLARRALQHVTGPDAQTQEMPAPMMPRAGGDGPRV